MQRSAGTGIALDLKLALDPARWARDVAGIELDEWQSRGPRPDCPARREAALAGVARDRAARVGAQHGGATCSRVISGVPGRTLCAFEERATRDRRRVFLGYWRIARPIPLRFGARRSSPFLRLVQRMKAVVTISCWQRMRRIVLSVCGRLWSNRTFTPHAVRCALWRTR